MTEQLIGGAWTTSPCETYHPDTSASASAGAPTRIVAVKGPFTFDVPVSSQVSPREADLQQVAQAGGERVVLERIVVTPTDTRVYLWREAGRSRYFGHPRLTVALTASATAVAGSPSSQAITTTYEGTLIPNPLQDATAMVGTPPHTYRATTQNPAGSVEYDFLTASSLYDYHGPWTLVVPTPAGSVTFHFTVGDAPTASGSL